MSDGVMVAFFLPPDTASKLAVKDGEAAGDLHLTLAFLGKVEGFQVGKDEVADILRVFALKTRPITGHTNGVGRFYNKGEDKDAVVALFDSVKLPKFYQELVGALGELSNGQTHGFTPHITLAYVDKGAPSPIETVPDVEITFTQIVLAWGDERLTFDFSGGDKVTQASGKIIRCGYEIEREVTGDGTYKVLLSTGTPIRQGGYTVNAAGGKFDAFVKNPVVMWAHDYDRPPIGRGLDLSHVESRKLAAHFEFSPQGVNPFADMIHQLWDARFINAASIGFEPIETQQARSRDELSLVDKWELYEFSIVPIPRDREALRLAVDGFDHAEELLRVANVTAPIEPPAKTTVDPQILYDFLRTLKGVYNA